jgi:hypothetical protein
MNVLFKSPPDFCGTYFDSKSLVDILGNIVSFLKSNFDIPIKKINAYSFQTPKLTACMYREVLVACIGHNFQFLHGEVNGLSFYCEMRQDVVICTSYKFLSSGCLNLCQHVNT